jgi:hypothetical protein
MASPEAQGNSPVAEMSGVHRDLIARVTRGLHRQGFTRAEIALLICLQPEVAIVFDRRVAALCRSAVVRRLL